ncbi:DNA repair ATPase [Oceanisphaera sp.]|uniref:DNA repair ATPase n=1 Tax=Oceanisphaera sp. TaxID=1929979 RepID=UPI003A903930
MTLTLILMAIGALLLLIIIYNIVQQYWQKQEEEKRALLLFHNNIINETDDLLHNANQLPFSNILLVTLYNRMLHSLQTMQQQNRNDARIKTRCLNIEQQIRQITKNEPSELPELVSPDSDQQAIHMLKVVKRLRAVLDIEHNKGRIDNQDFFQEDRRLELIRLKLNLTNLSRHTHTALDNDEPHTARQMLEKGLAVLEKTPEKDEQLNKLENNLQQQLDELTLAQEQEQQEKKAQQARQEEQEKSELDVLFEPKRKW